MDHNIYVEMADGTKYIYQAGNNWGETTNVVQSYRPSSLCPWLRPQGKVAAEFCYGGGYGDKIFVVLEEGTVWRHEVPGDDNYQAFKFLGLILRMIRGGVIGGVVGIFIMIIVFGPRFFVRKGN